MAPAVQTVIDSPATTCAGANLTNPAMSWDWRFSADACFYPVDGRWIPNDASCHCGQYGCARQSALWFAPNTTAARAIIYEALGRTDWRACAHGFASRAALDEAYLALPPDRAPGVDSVFAAVYLSPEVGEDPHASATWGYTIGIPSRGGDGKWCSRCEATQLVDSDGEYVRAGPAGAYRRVYRDEQSTDGAAWMHVMWLQWALDIAVAVHASPSVRAALGAVAVPATPPMSSYSDDQRPRPPKLWRMPMQPFRSSYKRTGYGQIKFVMPIMLTLGITVCLGFVANAVV
eukprot:1801113-Prymnesium_polylepis.1